MLAVGICFGATGVAWNGVYFAEIARVVRREEVSQAAAGGMFFSFLGGITGPALITLLIPAGHGYALGFMSIALIAALAGLRLILQGRST